MLEIEEEQGQGDVREADLIQVRSILHLSTAHHHEVQCLLIDRERKPAFGDVFSVEVHALATIEKLRDAIKARRPTLRHMDIDIPMLTVWRCLNPKLLSTMNLALLKRELRDISFTDETNPEALATGRAVKDLHLSDGEVLLVEVPGA